jgi:hypothetical protein
VVFVIQDPQTQRVRRWAVAMLAVTGSWFGYESAQMLVLPWLAGSPIPRYEIPLAFAALMFSVFVFPPLLILSWSHKLALTESGELIDRHATLISRRTRRLRGAVVEVRVGFDSVHHDHYLEVVAEDTIRFGRYSDAASAERDAARLRSRLGIETAAAPSLDGREG